MKRRALVLLFLLQLTPLLAAEKLDPLAARAQFCEKLAGLVGDQGMVHPEVLSDYVERIHDAVVSDRSSFIFNISAKMENGRLVLTGEAERPEFPDLTKSVFELLGFTNVVDQVEILPDLKKDPAPFAVAVKPYLMTWSQPDLKGHPQDEVLLGEPVYIFKEVLANGHQPDVYLIKNFSGYWGYADKSGFRRVSKKDFIQLINEPKALLLADYKTKNVFIPAGCRLPIKKWGLGRNCLLLGANAEELKVPKTICLRHQRGHDMAGVLARAKVLLGRPYDLGGKNSITGIDCSGLVQLAYRPLGINLARDAKQQYLNGDLILPCVSEALQPGDAIFFMDLEGKVNHTALYLGNGKIIQAQGEQVNIQSMNPADKNYDKRFDHDFIGAKRYWW
jgi:NlpC/P60 family